MAGANPNQRGIDQGFLDLKEQLAELREGLSIIDEDDPTYGSLKERIEEAERLVEEGQAVMAEARSTHGKAIQQFKGYSPGYAEMASEMPKWRVTVLVTLNSAGMVAILNIENLDRVVVEASIAALLFGLVFALASGSALAEVGKAGLIAADEVETINLGDARDEGGLDDALKLIKRVDRFELIAAGLRYASLLGFLAGVVIAAYEIRPAAILAVFSGG